MCLNNWENTEDAQNNSRGDNELILFTGKNSIHMIHQAALHVNKNSTFTLG